MEMHKVLIADNDFDSLRTLGQKLQSHGLEVVGASDGARAVMAARQFKPDVVVLDGLLSVLNGYEAAARLKDDPQTSTIPIIIISPFRVSAEDRQRGFVNLNRRFELKADAYLPKPVYPDELIQIMQSLFTNKQMSTERSIIKMLIMDDNPSDVRMIKSVLRNQDIVADFIESVAEAKQKIDQGQPDFVLLDIRLPQMSGLEVLEHLKASCPKAAAVIMTAYSSEEAILESLRLGVEGILLKPISSHELKVSINNALEKIRLQIENQELEKWLRMSAIQVVRMSEELSQYRQGISAEDTSRAAASSN